MSLRLGIARAGLLACGLVLQAGAATIHLETFASDPGGWTDRSPPFSYPGTASWVDPAEDPPPPVINSDIPLVNDGTGSFQMLFPASAPPALDAFRITQSQFVDDYTGLNATGWRFDFYADTLNPVSMQLRLSDGSDIFSFVLDGALGAPMEWHRIAVPIDYASGWTSQTGDGTDYTNMLANVQWMEIQLSRPPGADDPYRYYVDNFALSDQALFIPEPASGVLLLGSSFLLLARRRLTGESAAEVRWRYLRLRLAQRKNI